MAELMICSSVPEFTKTFEVDADEVDAKIIQDEVTKRMRTLLGMGKITCEAEFSDHVPGVGNENYDLWIGNILSGTGVHFATVWVRVYS